MSKIKDTDYAYSASRIHAVERALLDKGKIMQIAEAKTPGEALRMIYDSGYKACEDYEASFEDALESAYELVYSIVPDTSIFDVFMIENDYHNLKVLLKAEFCEKEIDYLLKTRTRTPLDVIKEAVQNRKAEHIGEKFSFALESALDCFAESKNAQLVDMIIDRACFSEMLDLAGKTENEFIIGFVRIKIDLINIQTMMRLRKMSKTYEFSKKAVLEGGTICTDSLCEGVGKTDEELIKSFSKTKYASLIMAATEHDASALETACGDFLIEYIKKAKHVTLGSDPVFAYILAKENEVKQLRIIMVGKTNNMDTELIKRRLNTAYV